MHSSMLLSKQHLLSTSLNLAVCLSYCATALFATPPRQELLAMLDLSLSCHAIVPTPHLLETRKDYEQYTRAILEILHMIYDYNIVIHHVYYIYLLQHCELKGGI